MPWFSSVSSWLIHVCARVLGHAVVCLHMHTYIPSTSSPSNTSPATANYTWRGVSAWSVWRDGATSQPRGKPCKGNMTEVRPCFRKECPVDCVWSDWGRGGGGRPFRRLLCIHTTTSSSPPIYSSFYIHLRPRLIFYLFIYLFFIFSPRPSCSL